MNTWDAAIIRNLRLKYGQRLARFSDKEILAAFEDWNLSAKDEDFLEWLPREEAKEQ